MDPHSQLPRQVSARQTSCVKQASRDAQQGTGEGNSRTLHDRITVLWALPIPLWLMMSFIAPLPWFEQRQGPGP